MKKIISVILSISLAILSVPASFASAETTGLREKLSVRKLFEENQYVEKLIAHDFEVSGLDKYDNIKQSANSYLVDYGMDHGKVWAPGHTYFHLKDKVDSGLFVITFDIMQQTKDSPTFYIRTGDELYKNEGGVSGNMSERQSWVLSQCCRLDGSK